MTLVSGPVRTRLRKWFESLAYAGMSQAGAKPQKRMAWLGPLAGPVTRFLDGGAAPSDPFYLTNRTAGQKLRQGVLIAVPCLLVLAAIGLALLGYFNSPTVLPSPSATLTPERVAADVLPKLDRNARTDPNRDIDVTDVHVAQGRDTKVTGKARNNTGRPIRDTELVFELMDSTGSRLGAVSTRLELILPKGTASFSFPVEQRDAAFALVREVNH